MKKFLGIVIFVLLCCNISFAEFIEFNRCYDPKYSSFDDNNNKRHTGKYLDHVLTIDTNAGTITKTLLRDSNNAKKTTEILSEIAGKEIKTNKITQQIYGITTYSAGYISGERIGKETPGVLEEYKIFVNLAEGTFDIQVKMFRTTTTAYGKAGELAMQSEIPFKCEGVLSDTAETSEGSSGTAFFINNRGNLLTNNHEVDGCKSLSINYNNKEYDTQLIATDKTLDLALLKANVRSKSFINFSNYNPKKLQKIYVAGYPFGKGLSDDLKISSGIISSLKGVQDNSNELQIDAAINHGNSGGPIVGEGGELIAIAVSGLGKEMSEGINFGIKSSAALNFLGANDIDPSRSNRSKLKSDKLLKILEESTLYISCTY